MKRVLVLLFVLALPIFSAKAQKVCEWSNGLAVRNHYYDSDSFGMAWVAKKYFDDRHSLDLALLYYTNQGGSEINALYEWSFPLPFAHGLNAFVGPGAHVGFVSSGKKHNFRHATYGVVAAAGLEYKIAQLPLMFSLDWRPHLTFRGGYGDIITGLNCVNFSIKLCI